MENVKPLTKKEFSTITESEFQRIEAAINGKTVIANMRKDADVTLIKWAKRNGIFVRIDRKTAFGNPFRKGTREQMIADYRNHINRLVNQLCGGCCGGTLPPTIEAIILIKPGSVLGCWCHPLPCHGEIIAKIVNDHYCRFAPVTMPVKKPQQLSLF